MGAMPAVLEPKKVVPLKVINGGKAAVKKKCNLYSFEKNQIQIKKLGKVQKYLLLRLKKK